MVKIREKQTQKLEAAAAKSSKFTGIKNMSTPSKISLVLLVLVAVVIYGVLVIALRAITKDDLMLMPKGEKIARMLHL